MASVTTNYGFDVPTSSDLVKNGATQIALLGQDIDTFLLRPFNRNFAINGGMDVWQRGTSFAVTTAAYTADRWQGWSQGPLATVSRQATSDTTNLPFIQYCARVQRNSGQTLTNAVVWQGTIETANSLPLAGKAVTVSFYARAGSNFSAAGSTLTWSLLSGTGTDQVVTAFTGSTGVISTTATLTTTWQRFQATATVGATATELGFQSYYIPVGTASTNDYFEITGIQIEQGSVASPFVRSGGTIGGELAMCQRYFERIDSATGNAFTPFGTGLCASTAIAYDTVNYTIKRVLPSMSFATAAAFQQTGSTGAGVTCSAISSAATGISTALVTTSVASGLVAGDATILYRNSSAAAYIDISAEL
jgi:hypothetical protein